MAKEDLKLRVTSNAPLTTKGSALTWVELDANWINIYNAFLELSQSSYVDAYSASKTYDNTIDNYAMYSSQIWKCISSTPIIAITPVEGANWTKKYATDLVGKNSPIYKSGTFVLSASGNSIAGSDAGITLLNNGIPATLNTLVGGTGYTAGVKATTGGTGTGLTVDITVSGGVIQTAAISNAGTGYTTGDTVAIAGGTGGTINVATIEPVIIRIPTTKALKLWQGLSFLSYDSRFNSDGRSDGLIQ